MPHAPQIRLSPLKERRSKSRRPAITLLVLLALISLPASGGGAGNGVLADLRESFSQGYFQVVGKSGKGQSRYRATRSAAVEAQKKLVGIIQRIRLGGLTPMGEAVTLKDVSGFLRGAVKCGESYDSEDGSAQVCMKLNLYGPEGLYERILPFIEKPKGMPQKMQPMPSRPVEEGKGDKIHRSGPGDGLILDVRGHDFTPALFNRILTASDQIIFDPAGLSDHVLIDRGCGGYTSDMQKARALLSLWGSEHPLIVTCAGTRHGSDVRLHDEDVQELFKSDKTYRILEEAKVVFVLD